MLKFAIPAVAALAFAASAQAKGPNTVTVSVTVPYADLDLTAEAGLVTLNKRIARAVKQVCGTTSMNHVQLVSSGTKCREEAMEDAMEQVAALRLKTPLVASAR